MPDYRRNMLPGGTFFFTLVTGGRQSIFRDADARGLLHSAIEDTRQGLPFTILASVLLPDHLHMIWKLPPGDTAYPARWSKVKSLFTRRWLSAGGTESAVSLAKKRDGRRGVWQPHYYEHTICDEEDFINHVEYIHYNPVKHGLVQWPRDWAWSSFHRYVKEGHFTLDWCCGLGESPAGLAKFKDEDVE